MEILYRKVFLSLDDPQGIREFLVGRREETANGCWEWPGATTRRYGVVRIKQRNWGVHRLMAWLDLGLDLFSVLQTCHVCDNRKCYNPQHLFIGTNKENYYDSKKKGRHAHGEKHGHAKTTEEDVRRIREEAKKYPSIRQAAFGLKLPYERVYSIVTRNTWKHVL